MTAALRDAAGAYYCADVAALRADVGRLLKLAIRLLKRNEIRTVSELPMADAVDKLETWFCEVVDLSGAAGRIRTHDPLVRSHPSHPSPGVVV